MTPLFRYAVILGAALALLTAPLQANARNLVEMAKDSGSFKQLLRAIDLAGLTPALSNEGPFTLVCAH